jgi:hypothetical protein
MLDCQLVVEVRRVPVHQLWADAEGTVAALAHAHNSLCVAAVEQKVSCFDDLVLVRHLLEFRNEGNNLDSIDKRRQNLSKGCHWEHKAILS